MVGLFFCTQKTIILVKHWIQNTDKISKLTATHNVHVFGSGSRLTTATSPSKTWNHVLFCLCVYLTWIFLSTNHMSIFLSLYFMCVCFLGGKTIQAGTSPQGMFMFPTTGGSRRRGKPTSKVWLGRIFLLIGCRTVSCFWKPAFLDYRYLWTFTVFGKDVFFVFLVFFVSILCLPLSPGETSVEKNMCWLYMLPKCLKRRRDTRVKSYFGNLSDSQGWGDFCKLCFLEVTRSYSKYIYIYFCRWVSLQHMGNKCG